MLGLLARHDPKAAFPTVGGGDAGRISLFLSPKHISAKSTAPSKNAHAAGETLEWKTGAVPQAAEGLDRSRGSIRAPNLAVSRGLFAGISDSNPLPDAFAQAIWVSWTLLPRVQSERLP